MQKNEIEEFAEIGKINELRQFVVLISQMLTEKQLNALKPYFKKKVSFSIEKGYNEKQTPEPEATPKQKKKDTKCRRDGKLFHQ